MKVFFADSSELVCKRLAEALAGVEGLEIVGQAKGAHETLRALQELKPDVAVLDVHSLGRVGLDWLKALKRAGGGPSVMMFTDDVSSLYAKLCVDAGADFLLSKSSDLGRALEILRLQIRLRAASAEEDELKG